MGGLSNVPIPDLPTSLLTPKLGVEKSAFQFAAKQLEINKNVNRACLVRHFLALNLCLKQLYSFHQSPQMSERISSTICAVVEWPDHRCGDDPLSVGVPVIF